MKFEQMRPESVEDYIYDENLLLQLKKLPIDIRMLHAKKMSELSDSEALVYIENILKDREKSLEEFVFSDERLKDKITSEDLEQLFLERETPQNLLGFGTTARIKKIEVAGLGEIAVKYLVTPNSKTLSVSGEHDLLFEVNRMKEVESVENHEETPLINVPHPYFYYKSSKVQSYGMEKVDGFDLEDFIVFKNSDTVGGEWLKKIQSMDESVLLSQFELFLSRMHKICLHGDIKRRNIMISRSGEFYLIDFGQSVNALDINDKQGDSFENLKEAEIENTKICIKNFFKEIRNVTK